MHPALVDDPPRQPRLLPAGRAPSSRVGRHSSAPRISPVLLEREDALGAVRAAFEGVRAKGRGRFVIIGGEAGVGKTSLLHHAVHELANNATVLWGACDSLSTPRALGPLADIATQCGGELAEMLVSGAPREAVFGATLRLLSARPRPTVVVIEDAHWADEATVDLLTFLRRRVDATRALVLVSYRDDEITQIHPLRLVLGQTQVSAETRLYLRPLSLDAIATLARGTRHRRRGRAPHHGRKPVLRHRNARRRRHDRAAHGA